MRCRMQRALRRLPRISCELYRSTVSGERGVRLGRVEGWRYEKACGSFSLALPGQLYAQSDGQYMVAFFPERRPEARPGDLLALPEGDRPLLDVADRYGAYEVYHLGEVSAWNEA